MTLNIPLVIEVLANIEFARERRGNPLDRMAWDQNTWSRVDDISMLVPGPNEDVITNRNGQVIGVGTCGTAMCAAGWTLNIARVPLVWDPIGEGQYGADRTATGERVPEVAAALLGLPEDEAYDGFDCDETDDCDDGGDRQRGVFDGDNTIDDLYQKFAHYSEDYSADDLREMVQANMAVARRYQEEQRAIAAEARGRAAAANL